VARITGRLTRFSAIRASRCATTSTATTCQRLLAFFTQAPRPGEVYTWAAAATALLVLEAVQMVAEISGRELTYTLSDQARIGDHIWWVSDVRKFQGTFRVALRYDIRRMSRPWSEPRPTVNGFRCKPGFRHEALRRHSAHNEEGCIRGTVETLVSALTAEGIPHEDPGCER